MWYNISLSDIQWTKTEIIIGFSIPKGVISESWNSLELNARKFQRFFVSEIKKNENFRKYNKSIKKQVIKLWPFHLWFSNLKLECNWLNVAFGILFNKHAQWRLQEWSFRKKKTSINSWIMIQQSQVGMRSIFSVTTLNDLWYNEKYHCSMKSLEK